MVAGDIFLIFKVKEELSGLSLNHRSLEQRWGGVTQFAATKELAIAFRRRFERRKMFFCLGCVDVNKIIHHKLQSSF
jgi:hypothetical protein